MKLKRIKKILVVDDNKNDRMLLRKFLSTNNYDVSEACDGNEALQYVITSAWTYLSYSIRRIM
jgi:CheY-like chemotaxis protein